MVDRTRFQNKYMVIVMLRKIDKMHELFGKSEGCCSECKHLVTYEYRDKRYKKCKIYGVTNSESSDWRLKNRACGLLNQEYAGDIPIIRLITPDRGEDQIQGQISMFGGENE